MTKSKAVASGKRTADPRRRQEGDTVVISPLSSSVCPIVVVDAARVTAAAANDYDDDDDNDDDDNDDDDDGPPDRDPSGSSNARARSPSGLERVGRGGSGDGDRRGGGGNRRAMSDTKLAEEAALTALLFGGGGDGEDEYNNSGGGGGSTRGNGEGTTTKIHGMQFPDMPITCASFVGGYGNSNSSVVVSGRRPFFYVYDASSGAVQKVPGIVGRKERSLEKFRISPDGRTLAFVGNDGYVILVDGATRQWIGDLKMNGSARAIAFTDDGEYVLGSGSDGDVYR